ncbi:MAG: hypothetical protein PHR16_17200 [Methylovulum sp.]|nr:hypothetical protein [Methylovulum sp.]
MKRSNGSLLLLKIRGLVSQLFTAGVVFATLVLPAYADNNNIQYGSNGVDSPDPSAVGYRIIPGEYPVKKTLLIKDIIFHPIKLVEGDKWLVEVTRTPGWSSGKYDEKPKLAFLDMTTGELTYTPYEGRFRCFDGNRIAYYPDQTQARFQVMVGEYGGKMEPFTDTAPSDSNGMTLDKQCQIIKRSDIPHKDYGTKKIPGLRASYAFPNDALFTVQSIALEPTYPTTLHMPPVVSKVMQDKWMWRGPNGETKLIPTNNGEVFGMWNVLPFEGNALLLRPQTTNILAPYWIYKHERILYPDGRLEVFPFPDLIWEAILSGRGQVSAGAYMYTKAGLIWSVQENSKIPSGDYIEDRKNKTLTKVSETGKELGDGCRQLTQKSYNKNLFSKEWFYEYYILDFCTKDNK